MLRGEDLPAIVDSCAHKAATLLEMSHSDHDAGSQIGHKAGCGIAARIAARREARERREREEREGKEQAASASAPAPAAEGAEAGTPAPSSAPTASTASASAPAAASTGAAEDDGGVDDRSWVARSACDRNPSVLGIAINYPLDEMEMMLGSRAKGQQIANVVTTLFGEYVNWMSIAKPPTLDGISITQRTDRARSAHAQDTSGSAGSATDAPAPSPASGPSPAAASAYHPYFAWIADEQARGLAGEGPGCIRSPHSGVYRLQSLVCHVGLHYVTFQHAPYLPYGKPYAPTSMEGPSLSDNFALTSCWKHYDDDEPVVQLPNWASVSEACVKGHFRYCEAAGHGSCGRECGFNHYRPLVPRLMLYQWLDPRAVIREGLAMMARGIEGVHEALGLPPPTKGKGKDSPSEGGAAGGAGAMPVAEKEGTGKGKDGENDEADAPLTPEQVADRLRGAGTALSFLRRLACDAYTRAVTPSPLAEGLAAGAIDKGTDTYLRLARGEGAAPSSYDATVIAGGRRAAYRPPAATETVLAGNDPGLQEACIGLGGGDSQAMNGLARVLYALGFTASLHPSVPRLFGMSLGPYSFENWVCDRSIGDEGVRLTTGILDQANRIFLKTKGVTTTSDGTGAEGALQPGRLILSPERVDVWLLASALRMIDGVRALVARRLLALECRELVDVVSMGVPADDALAALATIRDGLQARLAGVEAGARGVVDRSGVGLGEDGVGLRADDEAFVYVPHAAELLKALGYRAKTQAGGSGSGDADPCRLFLDACALDVGLAAACVDQLGAAIEEVKRAAQLAAGEE